MGGQVMKKMPSKPFVAIATLGGTITMTNNEGQQGVSPTWGADQLIASVPGLAGLPVGIALKTMAHLASGSITFFDLIQTLVWAKQQVEAGASGVMIVQGTDTLEESAFLCDLYWPYAAPLVLTGAMRSPSQAGAEGAANLLAAIQVATSPHARTYGALVVMNDEIHQARFVRKTHATALNAFSSPFVGALGNVREGKVSIYRTAIERSVFPLPSKITAKVLLIESVLNESVDIYRVIPKLGYQGVVIAGFGSGHVSEQVRDALVPIIKEIPVFIATRTGAGSTTQAVYGYKGGEVDLQKMGAVMVGSLCPRKARLLLLAMLTENMDRVKIEEGIVRYKELIV